MKIVALADTHGIHDRMTQKIPDGDVLVFAGDCTNVGQKERFKEVMNWLRTLPHKDKLLIAGNHDWCLYHKLKACKKIMDKVPGLQYLQDSGTKIDGVKFYGSPWQPEFCDWAFNLKRGAELKAKWDLIPGDTDVLITHGAPRGTLDRTVHGESTGCDELREAVIRVKPRVHIFGHVHEAYGVAHTGLTSCINASICNENYSPVNKPMEVYI